MIGLVNKRRLEMPNFYSLFEQRNNELRQREEKVKDNLRNRVNKLIDKYHLMKSDRLVKVLDTATNQFLTRVFDHQLDALRCCRDVIDDNSKLSALKTWYQNAYKTSDGIQYQHSRLERLGLAKPEVIDMVITVLSVLDKKSGNDIHPNDKYIPLLEPV